MADANHPADALPTPQDHHHHEHDHTPTSVPKAIFLYSYPKVIFFYPTFFVAMIAGIISMLDFSDLKSANHFISAIFIVVFALNLAVFSFDFPRTTSLTLFFFIAAIILGILLLFRLNEDILPFLSRILKAYTPEANSTFYWSIVAVMSMMYLAVFINVRFDYWEVNGNELLHHHGFLSNMARFSAPQLKIDKEITDVFEYMLLRSGRLILHPSNEPRAIVLDNVININRREEEITKMLGALSVKLVPSGNYPQQSTSHI